MHLLWPHCIFPAESPTQVPLSTHPPQTHLLHRQRSSPVPSKNQATQIRSQPLHPPSSNSLTPPSDNAPLAEDEPYHIQQASLSLQTQDAQHMASHAHCSVSSSNPPRPPSSRSSSPLLNNTHLEQLVLYIFSIASSLSTRKADELISLLHDPDFSKSSFQKSISSAKHCLALQEHLLKERINSNGFASVTISDKHNSFSATLFQKRATDVLKQQLALTDFNNTFFQPVSQSSPSSSSTPAFAHPMAAALGNQVVPAIKHAVMQSPIDKIVWNSPETTGMESFVGLVQLYSDKFATSLKRSSINSYPIHITLLNFSDAFRRKCISENLTLLGYFPTSFSPSSSTGDGDFIPQSSSKIPRDTKMNLIQRAISTILNPLLSSALLGFSFRDAHGVLRHCHPILSSYCADIPEAKDILPISHGTRPQRPCTRCTVPHEQLSLNTNSIHFRTQSQTRSKRREHASLLRQSDEAELARRPKVARTRKEQATRALQSLSLAKYPSLFQSYAIFNITPLLSSYNIFAFKPLHNFHLGVSKLIKATAIERLRSESLFTTVGPNNSKRSFNYIRTAILKLSNSILPAIEKDYPAPSLHIAFSSSDNAQALNGFFTTEGLRGMLDAKDYRTLDMVFPFIGAFFDRCCKETHSSPITSVFTMYTDLLLSAMRYNSSSEWTDTSLKSLEQKIRSFKATATTILGPYHSSHLGTVKFHLLDHIVDEDIRRYRGLHFNDAGIFEHAHVLFNSHYSKTSKRRGTAHNVTIRATDRTNFLKDWNQLSANPSISSQARSQTQTRPRKPSFLRDGKQISFYDIFTAAKYLASTPNASPKFLQDLFSSDTLTIISQLGHTTLHSFVSLCLECLKLKPSSNNLRRTRLTFVNPAYVVGGYIPTLDNYNRERNELVLQEPSVPLLQRIFAVPSFGPSRSPKFSHILVAGTTTSSPSRPTVWVSKLVALVRFGIPSSSSSSSTSTKKEFAFVQFLELVPPRDEVDITLNCVCLRWSTDDQRDHTTDPVPISKPSTDDNVSPWFGLIPSTSILGSVHIVRENYPAPPFTSRLHWHFHRFYINRFYRDTTSKPYATKPTTDQ